MALHGHTLHFSCGQPASACVLNHYPQWIQERHASSTSLISLISFASLTSLTSSILTRIAHKRHLTCLRSSLCSPYSELYSKHGRKSGASACSKTSPIYTDRLLKHPLPFMMTPVLQSQMRAARLTKVRHKSTFVQESWQNPNLRMSVPLCDSHD